MRDLVDGGKLGLAAATPPAPSTDAWPAPIGAAARTGIVGDVVAAYDPITEADPSAVLVQLLAGLGSLLGPRPHLRVGEKRHGLRIWPLVVGSTATGRKGTAASLVFSLLDGVDATWALGRRHGIASGEAIVYHIRDDAVRVRRKRTAEGEVVETSETIVGVGDKRLFLLEEEFGRVLRLARKSGATLSATLREAWDQESLMTTSKTRPERATGAHVTVVGHITPEELRRELTANDLSNGFANRFVYILSRRSKRIAYPPPLDPEVRRGLVEALCAVEAFWRARADLDAAINLGPEARDEWEPLKLRLEREAAEEEETGRTLGKVLPRAPAQVLRLAAIYAALERTVELSPRHLESAQEVWRYSVESARWIFGPDARATPRARRGAMLGHRLDHTPGPTQGPQLGPRLDPPLEPRDVQQQQRVLAALQQAGPEGLSKTEIHRVLAGRMTQHRMKRIRNALVSSGQVRTAAVPGRRGRPVERWRLV